MNTFVLLLAWDLFLSYIILEVFKVMQYLLNNDCYNNK